MTNSTNKVFINLPVSDLDKSKDFFTKLGYSFNSQFTDDKAACLVISDTIYSMLITPEHFARFTKKSIADTHMSTEVIISLSADSKEEVDRLADKAISLGATQYRDPEIMDGMYGRNFADLDGHQWEVFWMDPAVMAQAKS
jgi:predicted lactoylglutathione lyase